MIVAVWFVVLLLAWASWVGFVELDDAIYDYVLEINCG